MAHDTLESTPVAPSQRSNRWKTAILRHPIIFIVVLMLLVFLPIGLIVDKLTGSTMNDASIGHDVDQFYHLGLALLVLVATGWWREIGFTPWKQWRALSALILPGILVTLILVLQLLSPINTNDMGRFIRNILANIGTGFAEEMLFRGVILYVLLRLLASARGRQAVLLAVVWSALLFGSLHLSNIWADWAVPLKMINQVVYTIFMGFYFAAWRVRMNTIWPMIALHAIIDTGGALGGPSSVTSFTFDASVIINDALLLAFALYGLWLIRGSVVRRGGTDTSGLSFREQTHEAKDFTQSE